MRSQNLACVAPAKYFAGKMYLLYALLKGIGQGFLISLLSFGPAFFTLIHTGIKGGRKEGLRMAAGIFLSEFAVALACFFGLSRFFTMSWFQMLFAFGAAIAIMAMGANGFRKNYSKFLRSMQQPISKNKSFITGFLMNLMNPFVILLWVGILAAISVDYDKDEKNYQISLLVNLMAILVTLFSMDMGKVFLSDYLGRKMSNKIYYFVNKYFGAIIFCIGIYFMVRFVLLFFKHFHFAGY